jgi:hypothetical protein
VPSVGEIDFDQTDCGGKSGKVLGGVKLEKGRTYSRSVGCIQRVLEVAECD